MAKRGIRRPKRKGSRFNPRPMVEDMRQRAKKPKTIRGKTKKSVAWFRQKVGDMGKGWTRAPKAKIGRMYTFAYDAKHKKTLPYFDKFPLIILINVYKDGFLGLNFHYLSPRDRALVFNKLIKQANQKGDPEGFDDKARFMLSWDSISHIKGVDKMVHRYLFKQIKSSIVMAPPREWENAIYLPMQKFEGATSQSVWRA